MKNNIDKNVKVLSVKNLRKYFKVGAGKGSFTVKAIDDISFDVYKGEVFGLVGESGCGKTTTGRTLLKLYSPTDGTVDFAYQSEGDSYETVRIGAGHSGNRHRIKKARANYKLNVLAYKPYYSQRYDITSLSKKELTEKYNEKNELKNNLKLQKIKNIQLSKEFKQLMYENYQNYILTIDDIKFDNYSRILDLENEDHKNSLSYINYQIKFLKKNHKIRVGAIKDSAALSKEEVKLQLGAINEEYNEERTILLEQKEAFILEKSSNDVESKLQIKLRKKEIKDELKVSFDKLKSNYYARNTELRKQYGESILGVTENTDGFLVKFKLLFSELILRRKNKHLLSTYKADIKVVKKDILDIKIKKAKAILKLFFARIKNRKTYENNKVEIAKLKTDLRLTVKAEKEGIKEQEKSNSMKNSSNVMSKIQMIFQDPIESLNPRMTVREIVAEGLIVQGVKDKDYIDKKVVNMLEMVGLSAEYLSRYPHEFSGGQRQRIGIARALIMEPEFIIADEPVSALDVSIQAQVINLLNDLKLKLGLTILFIAHDLSVIKYFTDRVAVMNRGKIVELASSEELFANPIHPYTKSLISAIPQPDPIAETTRKRINYDMSMHDYQVNKPFMHELDNEHFVYASDEELKTWIGEDEK